MENGAPQVNGDWRSSLRLGTAVVVLTFGVFGTWTAVARLDNAAIGAGVVAVESNKKTLQHLEGGIVREILVRDGASVRQGDLLVRLDPTRAEAAFDLYQRQLAAAVAGEVRLIAERDDLEALDFPPEVLELQSDPLVARAMADQKRQFDARRETTTRQIEILQNQIEQIRNEIAAVEMEKRTGEGKLVFISQELTGLRSLLERGLVGFPRVSAMEREQLTLQNAIARATIDAAKAAQRIAETELKIEQLREERREEASKQLPEARRLISDIRQQMVVASDTLRRIELRAPTDGTVQQLRIFTVGGVVRPGDPILDIVPLTEELVVRAKFSPLDVHTMRPGMAAEVRFPAFHRDNIPLIMGELRTLSSDRLIDEASNEPYFAAEVTVDRRTISEDLRDKLRAGLSADVIVPTGERTALEYMISPLTDRFRRAMVER